MTGSDTRTSSMTSNGKARAQCHPWEAWRGSHSDGRRSPAAYWVVSDAMRMRARVRRVIMNNSREAGGVRSTQWIKRECA